MSLFLYDEHDRIVDYVDGEDEAFRYGRRKSEHEQKSDEERIRRWHEEVLPEIEFIEDQDRREIEYHLRNI